jgi:methylmalonyl-CoA/ethylmalonyl-CoA epimerase
MEHFLKCHNPGYSGKFPAGTRGDCPSGPSDIVTHVNRLALEIKDMSASVAGIGITRLGQIAVNAKDVERAAAFYQDKLGLKLLFKAPPGLAFFDCGGVRLMLSGAEKPEFDHPSSVLYFAVPDIQGAYGRLKESGVHFEDEPHMIARMPAHDLWMTFFRDSEGNLLGLMSEVTR